MQRAPGRPHSKYPHVYPIVRLDPPVDEIEPQNRITVVKVLTSQAGAETEVSRLNQVNADKSCTYFYCTSKLIEQDQSALSRCFNISNDVGRVKGFSIVGLTVLRTRFPSAQRTVSLRENPDLPWMTCFVQPHGSEPVSSLWWRGPPDISSVTFDHDVLFKLPSHFGEAGSLFS